MCEQLNYSPNRYSSIIIMIFLFTLPVWISCQKSPEQLKDLGFKLYDEGKYVKALVYLKFAFNSYPEDPELIVRYAFCLTEIEGDVEGAISLLSESAIRNPDYAKTFATLGYIAYNYSPQSDDKNIKQGIYFTQRAAELDPNDISIIYNLASFFLVAGNIDSALARFSEVYSMDSTYLDVEYRITRTIELKVLKDAIMDKETSTYD